MGVWPFTISRFFERAQGEVRIEPIGIILERRAFYFLNGIVELLDTSVVCATGSEYAVGVLCY